ncbi:phosphomannomutase/phosphoglucomutase [Candidatus Saccharibacteria bacterium]|nr:phosphomannomutase/phosphoglucomutase [Candidatus Saccharibacteria bacterium]
MKVNPEIFKSYDVRGKVGSELTPEIVEKIGKAFADWLPTKGPVVVGRDMRPDSAELATALVKGLSDQGRDVWDIGQVTTEMVYFATGKYGLAGGMMVTASHNPGNDNGLKFCGDEARAISIDSGLADIRDAVTSGSFREPTHKGSTTKRNVDEEWINHALKFINTNELKPLKLAVDAGNGMAGKIFPLLEAHLPFEVTEMYFELDGTFPNHEANPMKAETLHDIIAAIKTQKLDGGVAFDADGDRAFLIDETGEVLTPSVLTAMLAEYFLEKFPGSSIVYNLCTSKSVPEIISAKGGKPVRSRVGHSHVKQLMRRVDAPFGGEGSGHFFFRDNWYADSGLIAALIGLYVLSKVDEPLSKLRKKYSHYAAIPETNYEVEDKDSKIELLKQGFISEQQDNLDGITVNLKNGSWFNVRPSNTESLLRLNAEAKTEAELDDLVAKVKKIIT